MIQNVTVTLPEYEYKKLVEFKNKIEKHQIYISRPSGWYANDNDYEFMGVDYALKKLKKSHEEYSKSYRENMSSEIKVLEDKLKLNKDISDSNIKSLCEDMRLKDSEIKKLEGLISELENFIKEDPKLLKRWWKLW